ncbi:MAG: HAMP domain-containing sensor histidine kinase [Chloroflexota bacterium]|nr:HAMP domain-containing sensor histidine kinase [Chloroflexota bacterium]
MDIFSALALAFGLLGCGALALWLFQRFRRQQSVSPTPVPEDAGKPAEGLSEGRDSPSAEFIGHLTHELRAPLAAIKGYAAEMGECTIGEEGIWRRHQKIIQEEAERLARLIDKLHRLWRLDNPEFVLDMQPVNVARIAEDAILKLTEQAEKKRIQLNLHASPRIPRTLGDPEELEQVLINLLDNGIKYSPPDSVVDVHLGVRDDVLEAQVSDKGEGIPAEDLPHIFDETYRARHMRTRLEGGSGLGLPLAKKIVEQHGGQITVESTPGKGSTFTVTLPLQRMDSKS